MAQKFRALKKRRECQQGGRGGACVIGVGEGLRGRLVVHLLESMTFWTVDTAHSLVLILGVAVGSRAVPTACLISPSGLAWGVA